MAITEKTKSLNKEHHKARDIAEGKKPSYDLARLKTLGKAGGRAGYAGTHVVLMQPTDLFYSMYASFPAEVQRYVDLILAEGTNGTMSFPASNEAWIGSAYFDSTGKNGYKQDAYEFMPTYFKVGTGCTKALLNRGFTKEQVDQFLTFETVSGVNP